MKNNTYNKLKWGALIAIPATATFCGTVLPALNVPNADTVVLVINSVGVLLGSLLGVSTIQYNKVDETEYFEDSEEV